MNLSSIKSNNVLINRNLGGFVFARQSEGTCGFRESDNISFYVTGQTQVGTQTQTENKTSIHRTPALPTELNTISMIAQ